MLEYLYLMWVIFSLMVVLVILQATFLITMIILDSVRDVCRIRAIIKRLESTTNQEDDLE